MKEGLGDGSDIKGWNVKEMAQLTTKNIHRKEKNIYYEDLPHVIMESKQF